MMISLAFLAPDLVNLKLGSLNLLMAELRKRASDYEGGGRADRIKF